MIVDSSFNFNSINFFKMDVFDELWFIKFNLFNDPDDILTRIFKETLFILTPITTFLFNK